MTTVLVVDDVGSNVRLIEAKLTAEYIEVITAFSGQECLAKMEQLIPDIVLLEAIMPGMDGFEVCRRIKANPKTTNVPVIMMTALDQPNDRVSGLESGADDFLVKPIDDAALFARVRSLVRIKTLTDELLMRQSVGYDMGLLGSIEALAENNQSGRILVIDDCAESIAWFRSALVPTHQVFSVDAAEEALARVNAGDFDLVLVSLGMRESDGVHLCSMLRSLPVGRHVPILVLVSDGDCHKLVKALEMGVNNYITRPVDKSELLARVRTQLRKKRFSDRLRKNVTDMLKPRILP